MTFSFLNKFVHKKPDGNRQKAVLVRRARPIWEGTIIGLIFLAIFALIFDGYIFVYRVLDLEAQSISIDESNVKNIEAPLFKEIKDAMRARAELFTNAGDLGSMRNPFEKFEKEEKKE